MKVEELVERELPQSVIDALMEHDWFVKREPTVGMRPSPVEFPKDLWGLNLSALDLRAANLERADLTKANLSWARLEHANLSHANLTRAKLLQAEVYNTNFQCASLQDADLGGLNAERANFETADMRGVNLVGGRLARANLRETSLCNTNLTNVHWDQAVLEANLSGAQGIPSASEFLRQHYEWTPEGIKAYKVMGMVYQPPPYWVLEEGQMIREAGVSSRTTNCQSGVNVTNMRGLRSKVYIRKLTTRAREPLVIWDVLIPLESLPDVVVPYSSEKDIRVVNAGVMLVHRWTESEISELVISIHKMGPELP
jgi:hypothetical protein